MSPTRRLLGLLKPYWPAIVGGLALLALSTPMGLFHPLVWKFVVDEVLLGDEPRLIEWAGHSRVGLLVAALGVMVAVQLLGTLLGTGRSYLLGRTANRFAFNLRNKLYDRLQEHSLRFFHNHRSGDLVSRAMGDVSTLEGLASNGIDQVLAAGLQLICVVGIIIALDWRVGLLTLVPMLGVSLLVWAFNTRVRGLYRRIADRLGDVSAKLQENLLGMLVIKAFASEHVEALRFQETNREYLHENDRGVLARSVFFPAVSLVGFLSNAIMLGTGAYFYLKDGSFTIGSLVALRGYWWYLFQPVYSLATTNEMLQRSVAAGGRIFDLMDEPVDIEDKPGAESLPDVEGWIRCSQLTFAHSEREATLERIDLDVPAGSSLGVVGPSGAGKSTLMSLLLRLYDPSAGSITIDNHDLRDVKQHDLRRHFAIVTQEPFLFNDTIRQNIRYGRDDATDEALEDAAVQANAHAFISALPHGYDTKIGERGVKLSGGQKQRLCIARAFLADPRILLLDEATASVEPESEAIIQAALARLMRGRTAIIVSHRLSMVRDADEIVVIEDGRITERGSHETLMAHEGWYARMYRLQMGEGDAP